MPTTPAAQRADGRSDPVPHCRIYLPLTPDQLRTLAQTRTLPAALDGFTAAAQGRVDARLSPTAATEEAEYLAFRAAAGDPATGSRRIVVSADASTDAVQETEAPAGQPVPVTTSEELPLRLVASVHIDEAPAPLDGEPDLLWYDVTELDGVVAELDR